MYIYKSKYVQALKNWNELFFAHIYCLYINVFGTSLISEVIPVEIRLAMAFVLFFNLLVKILMNEEQKMKLTITGFPIYIIVTLFVFLSRKFQGFWNADILCLIFYEAY